MKLFRTRRVRVATICLHCAGVIKEGAKVVEPREGPWPSGASLHMACFRRRQRGERAVTSEEVTAATKKIASDA